MARNRFHPFQDNRYQLPSRLVIIFANGTQEKMLCITMDNKLAFENHVAGAVKSLATSCMLSHVLPHSSIKAIKLLNESLYKQSVLILSLGVDVPQPTTSTQN